jgi:hypothetical protein
MSWAEYTEAARELAELRRADAAVHAERTAVARTAQDDIAALAERLAAQQANFTTLAETLRLPPPWFGAANRSPVTDLAKALHLAEDAADASDVEARAADQAGTRPPLLPNLSPTGRNTVIYAGWALVGWFLQCGLVAFGPETDVGAIIWSLCGIPAVAFFAGYFTVATLGQPRVGGEYPKNIRLGGAICFLGMPVAWLALIAAFAFLRP